jgi:hypothetical protein
MKKLGNYTAFGKIGAVKLKKISSMSSRGRKATKGDLMDSIPMLAGAGLAIYLYVKSQGKKPIPYDPTKDNPVVSR